MIRIIQKIICTLFCLAPHLGMSMDSIIEMQEGLRLNNQYLAIPPIERFEPVGENAKNCLKQMVAISGEQMNSGILALPTDIWEQIWKKLSDKTKTRLSKLSREFNRIFYQSMLLHFYKISLEEIFITNNNSKKRKVLPSFLLNFTNIHKTLTSFPVMQLCRR